MTYAKYLSRFAMLLALAYMLAAASITWHYKPSLGRSRFGGIEVQQPNAVTRISAHDLNCLKQDEAFTCDTVIEGKRITLTAYDSHNPHRSLEYTCVLVVEGVSSTCALSLLTYTAAYARTSNAFLNLSEPTLALYRTRNPLMHMSEPEIMNWMTPLPFLTIGSVAAYFFLHLRGTGLARFIFAVFGACVAFYPVLFLTFIMVGDFVD